MKRTLPVVVALCVLAVSTPLAAAGTGSGSAGSGPAGSGSAGSGPAGRGSVESGGADGSAPAGSAAPATGKATGHPARSVPLVIAHRGASGYRPEHTLAAYELAVAMGADYIEPDLVSTKDGVLVDRHEPEISGTTDVASRPEFAARKTTKALDGEQVTGWFTEDFTLAELKTLRAVERLPTLRQHNTVYDGRYQVPTFDEVLALRARLSKEYRRPIGVIPEIKHSTYFRDKGINQETATVALVRRYGLNHRNAPLWIQSFELGNLRELRASLGYRANLVFLTTAKGAPYDLAATGEETTYADLTSAAGLKRLAGWGLNGVGPEKAQVIPRDAAGRLGTPTSLVADAHAAGLKVTPWTFRNENEFLPSDYRVGTDPAHHGRAIAEMVTFLKTGIDGLFTDFPDTGVEARAEFLGG